MTRLLNAPEQRAAAVALIAAETGVTWTYAELREHAAAVAARLAGTPRGVVAWIARSVPESVAAYLGALASGHAVLPLPANLSPDLLTRILEAYEPDDLLFLADDPLPDWVASAYAPTAADQSSRVQLRRRRTVPAGAIHPDVRLLLSTSGSTGSPKLVRLTLDNVESNASAIVEALGINSQERAVTSLPLFYSFGLSVLHSHLLAGASLVLTERSVLEAAFWDTMERWGCTSLAGVPYTYGMLRRVGLDLRAPATLQTLLQAGGKMSNELIMQFHELMAARGGRLFVMYGQTEATARISVLPPHLLPAKLGSVGLPLPGGRIAVRTDDGTVASREGPGEIVYHGPNVMLGYAEQRADLARGDELHGTLETGDLGYLDPDGCLYVTGRSKRIAKVFGLRVSLDDLEARLATVGPVALVGGDDAVIVFVPEERAGIVAPVLSAVAAEMKVHHSGFRLTTVRELPLLPNGKVDYTQLQASLGERGVPVSGAR